MSERPRIAVVGCGIFGAEVALQAASDGFDVTVYEAQPTILSGASRNNQNRLHLGFHYPRDLETGRQSIRGFQRFVDRYADCILFGFPNAYFIADEGSLTSPGDYIAFCERLGAPYRPITTSQFPVEIRDATTGILCDEVVYDVARLRESVARRLRQQRIRVLTGTTVARLHRAGSGYSLALSDGSLHAADAVVNCTYADINRLTAQLGHAVAVREFEYTVVPIIQADLPKVGVTVMDGPFMTLLPFGLSDDFLLYNVVHTVVARQEGEQLDADWLAAEPLPFSRLDKADFFDRMRRDCSRFLPALKNARLQGFLRGPRMVLASRHATDARPSLVTGYGDGYYTVFSGKIDHCVWVAEEVAQGLRRDLGAPA